MRAPGLAFAVCAAAWIAGCKPPAPETTERIIRIQIEGCEDATPLPVTPTPLAVRTDAPIAPTRAPVETPVVAQPRVDRTPAPAARTAEALAEDFALRREGFLTTLAENKLHPQDIPGAYGSLRRADDLFRAKNYDEALRYLEVALLEARSVKIGEPFVLEKFKRVERRIEATRAKMSPRQQERAQKALAKAHAAFLTNSFRQANAVLYEVDEMLDRTRSAEAPRKQR